MQTVYEDGPKRDRRLWTGDLYLEALANAYSFKNHLLTKRCLYLLAGVSKTSGFLFPCVFESPQPHTQEGGFLFEYSLLFNAALKEYVIASGDRQTGSDLWPVAKKSDEEPVSVEYPLTHSPIDLGIAIFDFKRIWQMKSKMYAADFLKNIYCE